MFLRLLTLLCATPAIFAQAPAEPQEPLDMEAVRFFREEGLERSQVMDHLSWICDVHGPRLTGSPGLRRAQKWAVGTFGKWGLSEPRTETWGPFGRGWECKQASVRVLGAQSWRVLAYPKAWSPAVKKTIAEVVAVGSMSADELKALDLRGKIVLIETGRDLQEPFDAPAHRLQDEELEKRAKRRPAAGGRRARARSELWRAGFRRQQQVRKIVMDAGPLAVFDRGSKGQYGTVFVSRAEAKKGPAYAPDAEVVPQFAVAAEHYNRLLRMLDKGVKVEAEVSLDVEFSNEDLMEQNVLADLRGTDAELSKELVMLGAHFDSWHTGTGSTDNGCGSAVMMEAMRLLKAYVDRSKKTPRRTIRVALWSGEEQGILGSHAYVGAHFAESPGRGKPPTKVLPGHALLSAYYNLDNGTGRIRGVYQQGNAAVGPVFARWLEPFHDLGAKTLTLANTGSTDHISFHSVGLPGFQFIQDPIAYGTQTHHSNMDVWDHAVGEDLAQAATIIASFAWHTAQRDARLPRQALPRPQDGGRR